MDSAMKDDRHNHGVVLLMVVFIVALVSAVVIGMLQLNTEDVQIMRNHIHAAEALAIAEAGLDDALSQLRMDSDWNVGFDGKPFTGGVYTVKVETPGVAGIIPGEVDVPDAADEVAEGLPFRSEADLYVTSVATSAAGFVARVQAELRIGTDGPPYEVAIDRIRVNE